MDTQADLLAEDEQHITPYDLAMQAGASWAKELLGSDRKMRNEQLIIPWENVEDDIYGFWSKIAELPDEVLHQADAMGFTLLHWAVYRGQVEAARTLLGKGHIDANAQDMAYNTAIHSALKEQPEIVKLLLDHDVDVNIIDGMGRTVLERAFDDVPEDRKLDLATQLIEKGAHIILPRQRKQEILRHAIKNDSIDVVERLLESGTSLFLYCREGLLPSQTAEADGASQSIVETLQKYERKALNRVAEF